MKGWQTGSALLFGRGAGGREKLHRLDSLRSSEIVVVAFFCGRAGRVERFGEVIAWRVGSGWSLVVFFYTLWRDGSNELIENLSAEWNLSEKSDEINRKTSRWRESSYNSISCWWLFILIKKASNYLATLLKASFEHTAGISLSRTAADEWRTSNHSGARLMSDMIH